MAKAPILFVDDDDDDKELIQETVHRLNLDRPVHFFRNGNGLIQFLTRTHDSPFLIVCDMNLPGETGFDIKKRISDDPRLKYKSVPFIFWSTAASEKQIQQAYDLPAQGFFFKPNKFEELGDTFKTILEYWAKSQHPKQVQ